MSFCFAGNHTGDKDGHTIGEDLKRRALFTEYERLALTDCGFWPCRSGAGTFVPRLDRKRTVQRKCECAACGRRATIVLPINQNRFRASQTGFCPKCPTRKHPGMTGSGRARIRLSPAQFSNIRRHNWIRILRPGSSRFVGHWQQV